ncbi:MAG: hypothetical protein FWD12_15145 [Alphaproteobacteria bacterium]|nr:hypothetical protein [Alphaproteobacteria bacterium]
MGEAKRRKRAGTYGQDDPLAAARRFWRGREPGPAEAFQCPTGLVAVTLDVQGVAPATCLMDARDVTDTAAGIQRQIADLECDYYATVRFIAGAFAKVKQAAQPDVELQWIGPLTLWSALHHPGAGAAVRSKVSDALRNAGRAHITWQVSNAGLAIAVADKFVDLDAFIAHAPRDQVFTVIDPDDHGAAHLHPKDQH